MGAVPKLAARLGYRTHNFGTIVYHVRERALAVELLHTSWETMASRSSRHRGAEE